MKVMPLALLAAFAVAQPAYAEDAPVEAPTEAGGAAAFSVDMPIETLMADERSKAVLETHLPGIGQHPAYEQFKAMSLVQVMPWSQGMITEEVLAAIGADLAAIEPVAQA